MVDPKRTNRFNFQESWPIWLFAVVAALIVVALINRHQAPPEETAAVNEGENTSETAETQEAAPTEEKTALSMIPISTAPVLKTSVSPTAAPSSLEAPQKTSQPNREKKLYTVQIHSFQDQSKAQKSVDELKKNGYTPYLIKRDLKEKGIWYRVCVGEFESKQEANTKLTELKQKYKDSFVITR